MPGICWQDALFSIGAIGFCFTAAVVTHHYLNDQKPGWKKSISDVILALSEDKHVNIKLVKTKLKSPLETFNVVLENKYILFDNLTINIFIIFFLIIIFFNVLYNNLNIKKNIILISYLKNIFLFFFSTFKGLVINVRFERYFFFIFSIFMYIVFENIGGFYLTELSLNSHAVVTLFLSFILFFNFTINFVLTFNELSYKKFVQNNINIFFAIFLFFIELISFFIRPFSLGIRLFANILSGHILIHIFFNLFVFLFKFLFWFSILIFLFCLFILGLEIFVSLIQAYIFFILSLIYLKDVEKLH